MKKVTILYVCAIVALLLSLSGTTFAGQIIYVDVNATSGAGDGSSWDDAFINLQEGLVAAGNGDMVRVGAGIYYPDVNNTFPEGSGNREATFQLINGITIMGGYAGFDAPDPNARNIELYETILSGDLSGNDGPSFANNGENSYHVVTGSDTNSTAILDGFTVTAGNASGTAGTAKSYGGGMYNYQGSPTVLNCCFTKNSSTTAGGGVRNELNSHPIFSNCDFTDNKTNTWGGGMSNRDNGSPSLTGCRFSDNSSGYTGGGLVNDENCNPLITNCVFNGNSASSEEGGGMYNLSSDPIITNCTFVGNSAPVGGAIAIVNWDSHVKLKNCILWANTNYQIYLHSGNPTIDINYCNIENGQSGINYGSGGGIVYWGNGNIQSNPLFADAASDDYHLRSKWGRYAGYNGLWALDDVTSPAIDRGDPTIDLRDEHRTNGGRINMGAYGGTAEASMSMSQIEGDINFDGIVNMTDVAILIIHWLESEPVIPSIVNITWPRDEMAIHFPAASVDIEAEVQSDSSIIQVEFFIDFVSIGQDTDGSDGWGISWTGFTWNTTYNLTATATLDGAGTITSSVVIFTMHKPSSGP